MGFARMLRVFGGAGLAGALVFSSASNAVADQVRQDQWALKAFDTQAIWKISEGKGVTVAVIDGGVDADHVDLKGNVIEGKDFIDGGTPSPEGDDHGTAMASSIAAHGHGINDADGAMGLAPQAKILNIRDDGRQGDGFASSIRYAVDHGASVINISQGGPAPLDQQAESAAIAYALQKDVLVVAATGNDGGHVEYPAAYPGTLAVGAIQNNGEIWADSNRGPEVLLTAPGTHIVSAGGTTHTSYRAGTGTSDAAAYVSAAAALLRSKFPNLTPGQIVNRLVKSAGLPESAKGVSLPDERYGYGYIQPLAALTRAIPAGSKYGPLTVPDSLKQSSGSTPTPAAKQHSLSSPDDTSKHTIILTVLGLIALLIVALIVFVVVKIAYRNKGGGNGPGGPGSSAGYVPGQPPYGQQPQGNPYMPPQPGQPPYPNQPQQQPPSSWGNQ